MQTVSDQAVAGMTAHAAIHVALKQLGIADDDKRDFYHRQTGKRSLTEMTPAEHEAVLGELRRLGFRPAKKGLEGPFAKKLQALWTSGWNLGVVHDRTDAAMISFVKRQTGIEHTRFLLDAEDAARAVDALKAWLAREAGVDWHVGKHMAAWERMPGYRVAAAQWAILAKAGLAEASFSAFKAFVEDHAFNPLAQMTSREWAGVTKTLSVRVRKVRKG